MSLIYSPTVVRADDFLQIMILYFLEFLDFSIIFGSFDQMFQIFGFNYT